jgi:hypothetical protein
MVSQSGVTILKSPSRIYEAVIKSPQQIAQIICQYLGVTSEIDLKIVSLISQTSVSFRPLVTAFFIHRINVLTKSLRWKKWFLFYPADKIQRHAIRIATNDTILFMDLLTNSTNRIMEGLMEQRKQSSQEIIQILQKILSEVKTFEVTNSDMKRIIGGEN